MSEPISSAQASEKMLEIQPTSIVPESYFWGQGYNLPRALLPDTTLESWERVQGYALQKLRQVFDDSKKTSIEESAVVREITLSAELQSWREVQYKAGRALPPKGYGLQRIPEAVIKILGAEQWPAPLLTRGAMNGMGMANLAIGAFDAATLYSNYCADMCFYYEHGYCKVYPEFEPLVELAIADPHARSTPGGGKRREVLSINRQYIQAKSDTEEKHGVLFGGRTARLSRDDLLILIFCDAGTLGMAAEAIDRGFEPGVVTQATAFGGPATDVIDVGSDIHSSELCNSFLMAADITSTGVVSEDALRRVYDAYAHIGAKLFTENWNNPGTVPTSTLYSWHIINDRHWFLRRAVLGSIKMRAGPQEQRYAEWDEAFDEDGHTTGSSQPLPNSCNGGTICDQVAERLRRSNGPKLVHDLWYYLSAGPVLYVSHSVVDEDQEKELIDGLELTLARAYSHGLVEDIRWVLAHATHHAWQVNFLLEAAMFGSLLDGDGSKGDLDRFH